MPNIQNHSQKYIYTRNVYSRAESAKRDIEALYGITCQLADTNKKRKKISIKTKQSLQRDAKKYCIVATEKLTSAQEELSKVSGLGNLKHSHKLFKDEFGELQEDGTFAVQSLDFSSPAPKQAKAKHKTPQEKKRNKKESEVVVTPDFQKPTNGIAYRNPTSMCKALDTISTPFCVRVKARMIAENFVNIKERTIREHFHNFRKGLELPRLFGKGKTRAAYLKDVVTNVIKKKGATNSDGITVSPDDIAKSVQEVATSSRTVSRSTTLRLINAMKQIFEGRVKVRLKTQSRQSAEISMRPLPALIHVVAGTHFIICENGIGDGSIVSASDGAKLLYNLVSKYHDHAALQVVKPQLLFSTDDSAIFASKSCNNNDSNTWNISVQNRSASQKKNTSYFTSDRKNTGGGFKTGLTMRYTQTMNGTGHSAPIFLQLLHLNERQLPSEKCPDGIVLLKFPGLCIGSSQDVRNENEGYLVCVRQGTEESKIYDIYHRTVLIPHIRMLRQKLGLKCDRNIPNEFTAVSYMDGGIPQLMNTTTDEMTRLYNRLKITANKHNPARSSVEQPCDVTDTFRSQRKLVQTKFTQQFNMKRNEEKIQTFNSVLQLAEENYGLDLGGMKNDVVEFLICFSEAFGQSAKRDSLIQGMVNVGFIDKEENKWPDLNSLLATCGREVPKEIQANDTNSLKKHWKALCKEKSDSNVVLVNFAETDDISDAMLNIVLDVLTKDILLSFGVVREYSFDDVSKIKRLPNKKNEVVQYVKRSLKKPQILYVPSLHIQPDDCNSDSDSDTVDLTNANIDGNAVPFSLHQKMPSEYLKDLSWRKKFFENIKGVRRIEVEEEVADSIKKDADVLLNILQTRFDMHFITHRMEHKREHACFVWAERNLPRICAAITLASHTKKDLRNQFVTRGTTVLGNPCTSTSSIFCNARDDSYMNLHGCYLYYDRESGKWVRSGKAGGNGKTTFGSRDKEHAKASHDLQSPFYMAYADKDVVSDCREGTFQDLNQYCGLSFDPECVGDIIDMNDGLFQWSHDIKDWIDEYCKKREREITQKETQLMLVAYLFEIAYELCISVIDNKSQSGGFEAAVGSRHNSN